MNNIKYHIIGLLRDFNDGNDIITVHVSDIFGNYIGNFTVDYKPHINALFIRAKAGNFLNCSPPDIIFMPHIKLHKLGV